MALDERSRHELFLRLEEVLGPQPAEALMELMPPVGWADVATKRDLDALEQRMELRFKAVDHQFEAMDQRFEAMDQRFEAMDQRFEAMDQRFESMDRRFETLDRRFDGVDQQFGGVDQQFEAVGQRLETMEHKLLATMRGEMLSAVTGQTRTLVLANIGVVLSTAALAFTAAKLA
jgi:hypothetical protein